MLRGKRNPNVSLTGTLRKMSEDLELTFGENASMPVWTQDSAVGTATTATTHTSTSSSITTTASSNSISGSNASIVTSSIDDTIVSPTASRMPDISGRSNIIIREAESLKDGGEKYCGICGQLLAFQVRYCTNCGQPTSAIQLQDAENSDELDCDWGVY